MLRTVGLVIVLMVMTIHGQSRNQLSDDEMRELYERMPISFRDSSIRCDIPVAESVSFLNSQCSVILYFGNEDVSRVSGKHLYYRYNNIIVRRAHCECSCFAHDSHKLSLRSPVIWVRLWEFIGMVLGLLVLVIILVLVCCCCLCCNCTCLGCGRRCCTCERKTRPRRNGESGQPLQPVNNHQKNVEKGEKGKPTAPVAEKEMLIKDVELRQKKQLNTSGQSNSDNEVDAGRKSPRNPQYRYSEITSDI